MNYVRSPIPYMGNKFKLLPDLIPLFPKEINTFYDLFGGSGVVSANICNANKIVYNELNENIYNLVKLFLENDYLDTVARINEYVNKYNLPRKSSDVRSADEEQITKLEQAYLKIRDDYNKSEDRDVVMLYTLVMYSFSNLIRFNANSEFNMPVGNQYWSNFWSNCVKRFYNLTKDKNIELSNQDCFNIFENTNFNSNDFIYVDPPYTSSDAVYNEKRAFGGWEIDDDLKLFKYLDKLSENGIKWGLSNVYSIKGKINQHLIDWAEKNNYTVIHLNMKYYALGRGDADNDEVYICNYNVPIIKKESLW